MDRDRAAAIRQAAEALQDQTSALILAIDDVPDDEERRRLRRSFAELIAFIEEKSVFDLRSPPKD